MSTARFFRNKKNTYDLTLFAFYFLVAEKFFGSGKISNYNHKFNKFVIRTLKQLYAYVLAAYV